MSSMQNSAMKLQRQAYPLSIPEVLSWGNAQRPCHGRACAHSQANSLISMVLPEETTRAAVSALQAGSLRRQVRAAAGHLGARQAPGEHSPGTQRLAQTPM